jgi:hypothetical protein
MKIAIPAGLLIWWLIFRAVAAFGEPLSSYSTDSYAYFGTLGDASTFLGRYGYECKVTNTGKLEGKGDGTGLPTWDISTDSDSKRVKIGGGKDTNTESGGRMMLNGNYFSLSPGSVVIQAGRTQNIGSDSKGAFLGLYTSTAQPVIIGVADRPLLELGADRVLTWHEKPKRLKDGVLAIPIKVEGRVYYLELRR